jgi:site-specific DNA recombinase
MTLSHTTRNGTKRYRYYICSSAQKRGWNTWPSKSIPAAQIEEDAARTGELEAEQRGLEKDLARWHAELRKLSCQLRPGDDNGSIISRLADLQERIGVVEGRMRKVREQIQTVQQQLLDEEETAVAMSVFDPVWEALTPREQARVIGLLVERVDYDGASGKVSITFPLTGIKALAQQLAGQRQERSA